MAGVKGKSGPPGNKNANKSGFYSDCLLDDEHEGFEDAKTLTVDHEIALIRTRLKRAMRYEAEGGELPEGTQGQIDRLMGRLQQFIIAESILEKNARESGASTETDDWMERFKATGAHRAVHKPKANGNGKAKNGSHR